MMIIDTVKKPGYTQWIEGFVRNALENANIPASTTLISDMYSKRIYLFVDGCEYMIRTKNFFPARKDINGLTCSENVEYTLYYGHQDCADIDDPITLSEISSGILNIEWVNDADILRAEYEQYIALHGKPEAPTYPQEGEYITLYVQDICMSTWDLQMDIRCLSDEEAEAAVKYLVTGEMAEGFNTPKMMRYLHNVHQHCVDSVIKFCFENGVYDHDYTVTLISGCAAHHLCCAECACAQYCIVSRLYEEYMQGNTSALNIIKASLNEFLMSTKPYFFSLD